MASEYFSSGTTPKAADTLRILESKILRATGGGGGGSGTAGGNGAIYAGTDAARDATTPTVTGALWVRTNSSPPYQISVWTGSAWA